MTIGVTMSITGDKQLARLTKNITTRGAADLNDAVFSYAKIVRQGLFKGAITDTRPLTSNRVAAATKIKAKRLSKFRSVITMPSSLISLDSMTPHFVPLKRGRNITKWARQNFKGVRVGGRSRVIFRKGVIGNNIIYKDGQKSNLFVTPHPFIQKALTKERNKLPNELRKGLKKAVSGSRR